jgi:uncharacterized protein (TIGR04141 family)
MADMTTKKPRVRTLSIFLMKEGRTGTSDCLKKDSAVQKKSVVESGKVVGELVVQQSHPAPPKWLSFFADASDLKLPRLFNASNSAVFFVPSGGRTFALAFGYGRHLLLPGSFEEQFGLRVTLNSVDPLRLRSLDHKTFDAIASHSRTQTSQAAGVAAFGLDVEQDLLCAATGEPLDKTLGRRMTGMDALTVSVGVTLRGLPSLLGKYTKQFHDAGYKASFPWVDHIGEVRDPQTQAGLNDALVKQLRNTKLADLRAWLSVPQLIEWARVGGVRYHERRGELMPDLHLRDFFSTLRGRGRRDLSLETLKRRHAFSIGVDGDEVIDRWSIYECLYCEVDREKTTFLLSGGKWYRVDHDFVGSVNKAVKKLVRAKALPLPSYDDADEQSYNKRAVTLAPGSFTLVDRKLVRIGGSAVEPCDLLGRNNEVIHVKRYGGSSVLSHLFAQGAVAAQAFFQDAAFRQAFNRLLPRGRRLPNPSERPNPNDYEVVYAIVSRSAKPIHEALPFFSRLNLRTASGRLQGLGYRVSLVKIPVEERDVDAEEEEP